MSLFPLLGEVPFVGGTFYLGWYLTQIQLVKAHGYMTVECSGPSETSIVPLFPQGSGNILDEGVDRLQEESEIRIERLLKNYLLDTAGPLHSQTHSSGGCLCKSYTRSNYLNFQQERGRGLGIPIPRWELMAVHSCWRRKCQFPSGMWPHIVCVGSVNGPIAWTYRNLMGQVEEETKGCEDRRRSCRFLGNGREVVGRVDKIYCLHVQNSQ